MAPAHTDDDDSSCDNAPSTVGTDAPGTTYPTISNDEAGNNIAELFVDEGEYGHSSLDSKKEITKQSSDWNQASWCSELHGIEDGDVDFKAFLTTEREVIETIEVQVPLSLMLSAAAECWLAKRSPGTCPAHAYDDKSGCDDATSTGETDAPGKTYPEISEEQARNIIAELMSVEEETLKQDTRYDWSKWFAISPSSSLKKNTKILKLLSDPEQAKSWLKRHRIDDRVSHFSVPTTEDGDTASTDTLPL